MAKMRCEHFFDSVVSYNDQIALEVIRALEDEGLKAVSYTHLIISGMIVSMSTSKIMKTGVRKESFLNSLIWAPRVFNITSHPFQKTIDFYLLVC